MALKKGFSSWKALKFTACTEKVIELQRSPQQIVYLSHLLKKPGSFEASSWEKQNLVIRKANIPQ